MPVLWACVIMMGGFGVWWLFADLFGGSGKPPEIEQGSFDVPGGKKYTFTNLEFEPQAQQINRALTVAAGGRAEASQLGNYFLRATVRDDVELAWAFLIMRACAHTAGIKLNDEVAVAGINKFAKEGGKEITLREYERRVPLADRENSLDRMAVQRFRADLDKAQPEATWDVMYERYKSMNEDLRATFVFFETSKAEVTLDPKNNVEDRAKLNQWLQDNPAIRAKNTIQEELDAKVLYARFKDVSTEDLQKQFDERWAPLVKELKIEEPTEEALKIRYGLFGPAWDAPLKVAQDKMEKDLTTSGPTSQPQDRKSPFELLKSRLRIEWFATRLVEKAFEEVTRAEKPLSFEDAQSKYGLKLSEVKHLDSTHVQQQPDFGSPRAAASMFQVLREKSLKPGSVYRYEGDPSLAKGAVEEPGSSVAIWRLDEYRPQREATLDDKGTIDLVTEEYKKKRREDLAKEQAEDFRKAVEEKVTNELATKTQELDTAMKAAVEKQISDQKLDRSKPEDGPKILEIENAEKSKRDATLDEEKARVTPNMFQAVAAERFLTPRDTGWIPKISNRNAAFQPNDKLTISEKAEQFFRKAQRRTALAALKPGRMGGVEHEPNWAAAAVPILVERRTPTPEDVYKLSPPQLTSLKNQVVAPVQSTQFWSYDNFKRPDWFNLNVPSLEKAIEAKREADKASAEKRRLQEEAKKKKGKVRAEKMAQEALQSRPLFSGEDW